MMDTIYKIDTCFREVHENKFFFVMTQLTYVRVNSLLEVTDNIGNVNIDNECYFPGLFIKFDPITQTESRTRLNSEGMSMFTFNPRTMFEFSHNNDPGTLRYRRILESNCGLNDKFMFPYNSDMTYDPVPYEICGHDNGMGHYYNGVLCDDGYGFRDPYNGYVVKFRNPYKYK